MCRSALEYPPNGKRCAGANHLALNPAEYDAWRLKRNTRERELYYIRKNRKSSNTANKLGIPIVVPADENTQVDKTNTTSEPGKTETEISMRSKQTIRHLNLMSRNILRLGDATSTAAGSEEELSKLVSTKEERARFAKILESDQGELSYLDVKKQDNDFQANSTNEVARLILEDGSVGYFKYYEGGILNDRLRTVPLYGYTYLGAALNEVTAYKVAQALGEGYDDLVPETVFREYSGRLGTLQREAEGAPAASLTYDYDWDKFDKDKWRKAAIFETVIGSLDRHHYNFFVKKGKDSKSSPVLIDNGFSFPKLANAGFNQSDISKMVINNTSEENLELKQDEIKLLKGFKAKLDSKSFSNLFNKDALTHMRRRIDDLIIKGIHVPFSRR